MPSTATWSHSRPLVAWAVARVRVASGRRSAARRARASAIAAPQVGGPGQADRPADERRAQLARRSRQAPGSGACAGRRVGHGLAAPVLIRRRSVRATTPAAPPSPPSMARPGPRAGRGARRWAAGRGSATARSTRSSTRGSSRGSGDAVGAERARRRKARSDGRQELAPGARQDRPARAVGRPRRRSAATGRPGRGLRGQDQPPRRAGTGADRLREPLPVVLHEPDRAGEDGRRAAVVDGEVDAPEAGQGVREARGHVARRPASSRRCSGRRRRRGRSGSQGRPGGEPGEAGSRSTSWTSSTRRWAHRERQRARRATSRLQGPERPGDEVVEVARARPRARARS